jgi:hypothetical protein
MSYDEEDTCMSCHYVGTHNTNLKQGCQKRPTRVSTETYTCVKRDTILT